MDWFHSHVHKYYNIWQTDMHNNFPFPPEAVIMVIVGILWTLNWMSQFSVVQKLHYNRGGEKMPYFPLRTDTKTKATTASFNTCGRPRCTASNCYPACTWLRSLSHLTVTLVTMLYGKEWGKTAKRWGDPSPPQSLYFRWNHFWTVGDSCDLELVQMLWILNQWPEQLVLQLKVSLSPQRNDCCWGSPWLYFGHTFFSLWPDRNFWPQKPFFLRRWKLSLRHWGSVFLVSFFKALNTKQKQRLLLLLILHNTIEWTLSMS